MLCQLSRSRSNDASIATCILSAQILVSNIIRGERREERRREERREGRGERREERMEPGFLGEMDDSRDVGQQTKELL